MDEYVGRLKKLKGTSPEVWGELDRFLTQWLRLKDHGFGQLQVKAQHGKMNTIIYQESLV